MRSGRVRDNGRGMPDSYRVGVRLLDSRYCLRTAEGSVEGLKPAMPDTNADLGRPLWQRHQHFK